MSRLTKQEQGAIWILLVLLAGGAAGRWWIHHVKPATLRPTAPQDAAAAPSPTRPVSRP